MDELTAVQALGVALSVQAGTLTMDECQERAPAMLEHLRAMGWDVSRPMKIYPVGSGANAASGQPPMNIQIVDLKA